MDFPRITFLRRLIEGADRPFEPPPKPLPHQDAQVRRALAGIERGRRIEFRVFFGISFGIATAGFAWGVLSRWNLPFLLVPLGPLVAWCFTSRIAGLVCRMTAGREKGR